MDEHLLSYILFAPIVALLILLMIPSSAKSAIKLWANFASFGCFLVSLPLVFRFDKSIGGYQMIERADWIPSLGVKYLIGVDGISMLLVMLTTAVSFLAVLSSWNAIEDKLKEYYAMFLLLETGMLGVFLSLDLILFFLFWEVGLIPMYFLINIWGSANRQYASFKFFIYTMAGSVGLLLAVQTIGITLGTFDMTQAFARWPSVSGTIYGIPAGTIRSIAFWAFSLAWSSSIGTCCTGIPWSIANAAATPVAWPGIIYTGSLPTEL